MFITSLFVLRIIHIISICYYSKQKMCNEITFEMLETRGCKISTYITKKFTNMKKCNETQTKRNYNIRRVKLQLYFCPSFVWKFLPTRISSIDFVESKIIDLLIDANYKIKLLSENWKMNET